MDTTAANIAQFTFEVKDLGEELRVVKFKGEEEISNPFRFHLDLASEEYEINFNDIVGKVGVFRIYDFDVEEARIVNGVVLRFEQTGEGIRFTHYHLELVPQLYLLSFRSNNRIFQNHTIKEILSTVLEDAGVAADCFQFALTKPYSPREYCVQFGETDLDFISRLMEEEGIFYFFEHSAEMHKMVISDHESIHKEITMPEVKYAKSNLTADEGYIYALRYSEAIKTGAVKLKDFDFKNPALDVKAKTHANSNAALEVYEYQGSRELTERVESLAVVKLESLQVMKKIISGCSYCRYLQAGFLFSLKDHPRSEYNQSYLITKVVQTGTQPQALEEEAQSAKTTYNNDYVGIPSDVPYRPAQQTKKPRIDGVQTAIVVGPSGEEIYTDEFGRIKVQFHWDLIGTQDDKSSCWVRVSQLWAGAQWGAMFIPRIGQEVIVDFIEGDPDRPIVTGRVYHATNLPPYKLPDEKTKCTIRSAISKGSATHNELLMEDKQDETQVVLSNAYGHKMIEDEKTQSLTLHTRDQHIITLDDKNKKISVTSVNGHSLVFDDTDTENEGTMTFTSTTGYQIQLDDKNRKITAQTADGHIFEMDDENKKIELTTTSGHSAIFDDENEAIGITSSKGHYVTLDDSEDSITLEDSGGAHRFKIDAAGGGLLISTDSGSIDLEAPSGTIALKATNIELEADMDCTLSGLNVTAEAGMEFKSSGTMATSEASGINTISGSLVKIN